MGLVAQSVDAYSQGKGDGKAGRPRNPVSDDWNDYVTFEQYDRGYRDGVAERVAGLIEGGAEVIVVKQN